MALLKPRGMILPEMLPFVQKILILDRFNEGIVVFYAGFLSE